MHKSSDFKAGLCETQVWGVPWTEEDFAEQMVRFGHPTMLGTGLPEPLREAPDRYSHMDVQARMAYRVSKLGFWLRRLVNLKEDERALKDGMDDDAAFILKEKNILLWKKCRSRLDTRICRL